MKRNRTIRRLLIPVFVISTCVPILVFAVIFLYRLNKTLSDNIDQQIEFHLNQADQSLDMILDKYDTLLYDFCSDDELIDGVKQINQNPDTLESNSERICQEMSHISNRNIGIVGITILTDTGQTIFYDRLSDSSETTTWADQIQVPENEKTVIYKSSGNLIEENNERVYVFQIIRNIVDYHNSDQSIGTVVFSMEVSVLFPAIESGENSKIRIISNDRILISSEANELGKKYTESHKNEYRYAHKLNETSGFMIRAAHSLELYKQTIKEQILLWILIVAGSMLLLNLSSYYLIRPIVKQLEILDQAMKEVEKGNLRVHIPEKENMPAELWQITSGFNEMVKNLDGLIGQVKEAVVEQKNAELSALEAQIDPHFLYNTLDTINWKAIEEGQFEISEMLGALADILRYTVKNAGAETSIEQEVYFLEYYIFLQKAKLDRELTVEMQIPQELYGYRIHKLLIQPFVENALKHGLRDTNEPMLGITMREIGEQVHIIVWNNGKIIEENELQRLNGVQLEKDSVYTSEHLGIMNVRKRLALYYGDQAALYFDSKPGRGTYVHLFIPSIRTDEHDVKETERVEAEPDRNGKGGTVCGLQ
ncbi:sensor histidine kinase [Faecalicatena contorta]|uniref:sensor histidine kinase n=1 Tax=Faecalicatena contorta TaxID=39482 RepID=UPI001F2EDEC2|nr:histidine kinase [Faecalicatena contorta]MCF2682282.1 histidine kinase [Faecalicatena contorta]